MAIDYVLLDANEAHRLERLAPDREGTRLHRRLAGHGARQRPRPALLRRSAEGEASGDLPVVRVAVGLNARRRRILAANQVSDCRPRQSGTTHPSMRSVNASASVDLPIPRGRSGGRSKPLVRCRAGFAVQPKYSGALPGFHLMLQPTLGLCSADGSAPASTASIARRRSAPVTGTSLDGRLPSSCPR